MRKYMESIIKNLSEEDLKQLSYISRNTCGMISCSDCALNRIKSSDCHMISNVLIGEHNSGSSNSAKTVLKVYEKLKNKDFIKF